MKHYLLTPGPTPVPDEMLEAMARPIIHHRTSEYKEIFKAVSEGLKAVFKTNSEVHILTASGTGAMEAGVSNILSPGDKALVVRGGKFGERFYEICSSYGVNAIAVDIEWGAAPAPALIKETFKKHPDAKAVYVNLCETSTATVYDIKGIGDVVKNTQAVLAVDVISGLGSDEFRMDEWNVDVAIGGSQKGLMIPPGLAFIALSSKAWKMADKARLPRFYFDIKKYKKGLEKFDPPFTPAITLVIALGKALSIIKDEGVDNYIARHRKDASYVRDGIKKMGLTIYSKSPSDAVTAVFSPEGIDAGEIIKMMKAKNVTLAGGQGELKGRIFRIATMGGITREDLEFALERLKEVLKDINSSRRR